MNLREIYSNNKKTVISFEVFPEENTSNLYSTLDILKNYSPALVSLTYGAGGNNQDFSFDIINYLKNTLKINVMPHLTCICNSKEMVERNLKTIENLGIENILALRGDIPEDKTFCYFDFKHADQLVEFIKNNTTLSIAVAGYPEGHIESQNLETDIEYLKHKVETGADIIYTQLFFNNDKLYKFIEKTHSVGISIPIIPGIMPILSKKQIDKMTKLAKIEVPQIIQDAILKYNSEDLKEFGVEYATKQCEDLIKNDIKGLHFYTLNKHYSTSKILDNIL